MKRTALAAMIIVVFAASCAQAPTATPHVALPTATPTVSRSLTPTVNSTRIPTATLIPTERPTPQPTQTPIPTETLLPTATPKPLFEWSTNFENGLAGFNGDDHDADGPNSYYEIVNDPTDSGRGKVYRGIITGLPPVNARTDDGRRHRPYPGEFFRFAAGPFATEFDLWMSQPNPKYWKVWSGPDTLPWFSPVSLFDSTNPWHWTVGVQLAPSTDGKYYLVVLTNDNDQYLGNISDIPFPTETWVRIRLEVDNDRIARLYQDGQLISTHPLGSDSKLGTTGGHWGLYAGRDLKNLTVLNDNITLVVYPAKSD